MMSAYATSADEMPDDDDPAMLTPMPEAASLGEDLCVATRNNNLQRISQLCKETKFALRDAAGHTALHWASLSASAATLVHVIRLTRHPVDARSEAPQQRGQTSLHWALVAGSSSCVAALLRAGADPAAQDARGYNALIHCAQYGRVDLAHLLLLKDPLLVSAADHNGRTALHWASHAGHFPMAVYLVRVTSPRADVTAADAGGQTALHKACARGHSLIVRELLAAGADHAVMDESGRSPVVCLPAHNSSAVLSELSRAIRGELHRPPREHLRSFILVAFYYVILVFSYWFYVRYVEWWAPRATAYGGVVRTCAAFAFLTHSFATYGDPGDVIKGTPESCRRDIERAIANSQGDVALAPTRYCFTCLRPRPPRSKHSRTRTICVRRFDHECPWTNNAVGLRNHRCLLAFAASMFATQVLFLDHLRVALLKDKNVLSVVDALMKRPLAISLFVLHCFLAGFCILLLLQHAMLAARGLTTYEQIAYKRLGIKRNPNDRGFWRNLRNFVTATGPGTEDNISAAQGSTREAAPALQEVIVERGQETEENDSEVDILLQRANL